MTHEKPLVTWKDISAYLKVSEKVAQAIIKKGNVPLLYFGRRVAIYPSTLKKYLEGG